MKKFVRFTPFLFSIIGFSHNDVFGYNYKIKTADSLNDLKSLEYSYQVYSYEIYRNRGFLKRSNTYNAACLAALSGNKIDAFIHLFDLAVDVAYKYINIDHITSYTDLTSLHQYEDWLKL